MTTIKVLGPGCRNCITLEARTRQALDDLGMHAEVEKITDVQQIMSYGVMSTPGLVVDEQVVIAGKVPSVRKLTELLASARE